MPEEQTTVLAMLTASIQKEVSCVTVGKGMRETEGFAEVGLLPQSLLIDCQYIVLSDIDECSEWLDGCSRDGECLNTEGAYECYCLPGYHGDGFTCTG